MNDNDKGNNLAEIKPMPEGMQLGKVNIVLEEKWDEHRGRIVENISIGSEFEHDENGHVILRSNVFALGATIKKLLESGTLRSLIDIVMASWVADQQAMAAAAAQNEASPS